MCVGVAGGAVLSTHCCKTAFQVVPMGHGSSAWLIAGNPSPIAGINSSPTAIAATAAPWRR